MASAAKAAEQPPAGDVGALPGDDGPDVLDVDHSSDRLVAQCDDGRGHDLETVLALVAYRCAELLARMVGVVPPSPTPED